jgi:hypothetical protein
MRGVLANEGVDGVRVRPKCCEYIVRSKRGLGAGG